MYTLHADAHWEIIVNIQKEKAWVEFMQKT